MLEEDVSDRDLRRRGPSASTLLKSEPSFAKTTFGRQAVDLPALSRGQLPSHDQHPAPHVSTLPLPLRRPPPARRRELCLAPPARRVQKDGDPAETPQQRSDLLG